MNVVIDGRRVSLRAEDALGDGGEATVTRVGDLAVKIYHRPTQARAAKLEALIAVASSLPDRVIAPTQLVRDARGRAVIGFGMRALGAGHTEIASLSRRAFRASSGLGAAAVARMFLGAHATLAAIHGSGLVVGDLNDLNETFAAGPRGDHVVDWIDVDSFQLPGHPCEVATEAFLDPALYGPDLAAPVATAGGVARVFRPASDWYAFAVLLFRSLTLVHPFGGVDPALPTLPRRAAARRTVLSPGVAYPSKVGYALEVLSDDLTASLRRVLEGDDRAPFPAAALGEYAASLVVCGACGSDRPSSRRRCPSCAARAPAAVVSSTSGCAVDDLLEARGPVLAVAWSGGWLRAVAIEAGRATLCSRRGRDLVRTDLGSVDAAARVELGGAVVVVARGGDPARLAVHPLDGGAARAAIGTTTERFAGGEAAFAAGSRGIVRLARGVAMVGEVYGDALGERPLFEVMRGQTTIFAATDPGRAEIVIASLRSFGERRYALANGPRRADLAAAALDPGEAIVEEGAAFSDSIAALLRHTRKDGVDRVRVDLAGHDGRVLGSMARSAADRHAGTAVRGGLLVGGSLLFSTDRGVARERFASDVAGAPLALLEDRLFCATEPWTARDARLARFEDGLVVAHGATVRRLRLT